MILRPFKAVIPRRDIVKLVSSPPYDILEYEEVENILKENPYSFLRITRSEVEIGMRNNPHDEKVYRRAKENFEKFLRDGILIEDERERLFIYSLKFQGRIQRGIVATFSVDEYDSGRIKKHELTREDKELDRVGHISTVGAQTGPVYLFYRSIDAVKEILRNITDETEPLFSFETDGVFNEVHTVDEENIKKLVDIFKDVDSFYIADGHHRAAGASKVRRLKMKENPNHTGEEEYNYFLGVLFPHDELRILPYNRSIKSEITEEEFLRNSREFFDIDPIDGFKEPSKGEFIVTHKWKRWWHMRFKGYDESVDDPLRNLDTFILQEYVLERIFGVENPRKDPRLKFVGGTNHFENMERIIRSGEYDYGFFLHPTSIEDIMKISDAGKIMPPKSTWFEPKLRSGLFIHPI